MPNRPTPGQVEVRSEPLALEGRRIRGRIPYSIESRDLGGWREIISPGALNGAKLDDLVCTVDHAGVPLGRFPGTLEIESRDDGTHWSIEPPKSRQDVVEAVERGDLRAASWRMVVARDHWNGDVRHVDAIRELRDVSIVSNPAYPSAAVELRNHNPAPGQTENIMADTAETTTQDTQNTTTQESAPAVATPERGSGTPEATESRTAPENAPQAPSSEGRLRVEGVRSNQRRGLADEFRAHGFPNESAVLPWEEFESRAVTWSAALPLMNQLDRPGGPFPYDQRWVYPVVPQIGVGFDVTSVLVAYQTARALATPADVVRAIAATTTKPETGSTVNLVTVPLNQLATVESGVPNVYAAQAAITSIIESDMRLAVNDSIDSLLLAAFTASGFQAPGADNYFVTVRKAIATLQIAGFQPDVLVQTPTDALDLDVMVSGIAGGTADFINLPGNAAPGSIFGLQRRISKSAPASVVLDSSAFGKLYASPVTLARFEANNGLTNSQNLRLELNAAFGVERQAAAIRLAAA